MIRRAVILTDRPSCAARRSSKRGSRGASRSWRTTTDSCGRKRRLRIWLRRRQSSQVYRQPGRSLPHTGTTSMRDCGTRCNCGRSGSVRESRCVYEHGLKGDAAWTDVVPMPDQAGAGSDVGRHQDGDVRTHVGGPGNDHRGASIAALGVLVCVVVRTVSGRSRQRCGWR